MTPIRTVIALVSPLLLLATISASVSAADSKPVELEELAWIAGDWVGGDEETLIQEQWTTAAGGSMMGMFRLVQGDKVVFYEFMSIENSVDGPILRIKHFNPGLIGWEEKDESVVFDLTKYASYREVFETEKDGDLEQLVFERDGDELVITLIKPAKDSRSEFRYQKAHP